MFPVHPDNVGERGDEGRDLKTTLLNSRVTVVNVGPPLTVSYLSTGDEDLPSHRRPWTLGLL